MWFVFKQYFQIHSNGYFGRRFLPERNGRLLYIFGEGGEKIRKMAWEMWVWWWRWVMVDYSTCDAARWG